MDSITASGADRGSMASAALDREHTMGAAGGTDMGEDRGAGQDKTGATSSAKVKPHGSGDSAKTGSEEASVGASDWSAALFATSLWTF